MKKIISFFIFFFILSSIFAQTGTIRGFVYDKSTGEPIMFCNVFLKGTTIGAPTDVNGMYNISKVKSGNYQLVVTYLGYDTTQVEINLENNQLLTKNLEIAESSIKLSEVKISAEREAMRTEVNAAAIKITKKELEMVPTIGGDPDLAQYIQIIPGVT